MLRVSRRVRPALIFVEKPDNHLRIDVRAHLVDLAVVPARHPYIDEFEVSPCSLRKIRLHVNQVASENKQKKARANSERKMKIHTIVRPPGELHFLHTPFLITRTVYMQQLHLEVRWVCFCNA